MWLHLNVRHARAWARGSASSATPRRRAASRLSRRAVSGSVCTVAWPWIITPLISFRDEPLSTPGSLGITLNIFKLLGAGPAADIDVIA